MLIEPSIASFEEIRVRITFTDIRNKKREIAANCKIGFSDNSMQIVARKILEVKNQGKYKKLIESGEIPTFNEENLKLILEIARDLKVEWWFLMNIIFNIKNVYARGFANRIGFAGPGSTNLILVVKTNQGFITLELQKKKFNAWTPHSQLKEISQIISKFRA